jgi:3-dehydroquinate synthase
MKIIELNTTSCISKILISESLSNLKNYIPEGSIIITDENVYKIYQNYFPSDFVIVIEAGEKSKNLQTIDYICQKLLNINADRNTYLVGIGGGVITDITGFTASIYNRGLKFGFVPTTLLAQVDASIGGKNGINFRGYKNIIGTVTQPEFILSDITTLSTLPQNEIANGIAELVKTALIADEKLFEEIENGLINILNLDKHPLENIVYKAAKIKARIVEKDEKEQGLRRILNFGHTFGHAIETVHGLSHGQAISHGMIIALKLSSIFEGLNNNILEQTYEIFTRAGLLNDTELDKKKIMDKIKKDKKKYADKIKFVLLKYIENPVICDLDLLELEKLFYDMR